MDELIVAVFEDLVAVDVLDVEVGVKPEPLLILPLIQQLKSANSYSLLVQVLVQRVELLVDILKQFVNSLLPKVIIVIARHSALLLIYNM